MRKISEVYDIATQCRERIIKTMQERGISELATCKSYAEWCKENNVDPEDDGDDDTEYQEYKDQECPYCVFIHKYDMSDYRIEKVSLVNGRFKFDGFNPERGGGWQWEYDTVRATRIFVWERLAEILDITEEPEYVWVFTAEQAWDGEVADTIIKTFATEAAAQKYMQDFLQDDGGDENIRQYVKRKEWKVELDGQNLYRAYEDRCYNSSHIELTITKCEINE